MVDQKTALSWWENLGEEEQMWLMMKNGFDAPFDPKRVRTEEVVKLYTVEKTGRTFLVKDIYDRGASGASEVRKVV